QVKREINEIIEYLKNPALLRQRGVSRIGGVLLAGAPGTGKTLLAKAIAAESGVRMFTCSGTDFFDIYTGVGPRRIRETFQKMRDNAPAILFVDEFDALGAARSGSGQGDESAAIINEMLVQMDGFEDNRGVVVLGATNRPGAIDGALVRPGRFDRIVYMPLPDAAGRAKILQVHARNKAVDPSINWTEVARAMAGFTGADCMGLMQRAQRMAGRQGRDAITEDDMYAAMENKAMETFSEYNDALKMGVDTGLPTPIPQSLRKAIANYEAARALIAYITPDYEEIARVSVCPANVITGYTLFVEDEDKTAGAIMTRSEMEAHMVVHLAGRCAEKLTTREGEATAMCGPDMHHVNMIAREMVFSMGMGRRTGPMDMMYTHIPNDMCGAMVKDRGTEANTDLLYYDATYASTEQGRVAMLDVLEVLESAEAKAYYGLATNWKGLQALTNALLDQGVLQGREVGHILEKSGVIHFTDPLIAGFGWDADGDLIYPLKPEKAVTAGEGSKQPANSQQPKPALKGAHAKTWFAGTDKDAPRNPDGTFVANWHWGMPYSLRRDVPPDIKLAAPAPLPKHADAASMSPA
ncbi:P-loop containing nucleoside triphosphate hydrolase protein, partial [Haematococcus lacustris]